MSDRADGKFNVLIIDDSAFQVKQISKMLEAQNFNVVGNASDGMEGLKLFQQLGDEIDLVTLDITMPGMDGISCLKEIMKINPKANVVMMSALGKEDLVKESLLIGAKAGVKILGINYDVKVDNLNKTINFPILNLVSKDFKQIFEEFKNSNPSKYNIPEFTFPEL